MSDPTSGLPAADWYGDPSDPTRERWWGGLEWTEHTRPLDVAPPVVAAPASSPPTSPTLAEPAVPAVPAEPPVPQFASHAAEAPIPQFASQTAEVAVPQFASQTAEAPIPQFASQTTETAIPQFASQQPAAPFSPSQYTTVEEAAAAFGAASAAPAVTSWQSTPMTAADSPWNAAPAVDPYAFNGTSQGFGAPPSPEWNPSPARQFDEPESNVPATVGFVMSLLGFGLVSLIVSIVGVKKATRLENSGGQPTGRILGRLGIGLSILGIIGGLIVGGVFGYTLYLGGIMEGFDGKPS